MQLNAGKVSTQHTPVTIEKQSMVLNNGVLTHPEYIYSILFSVLGPYKARRSS